MISIRNKEAEACALVLMDMSGNICYETYIQPNDGIDLDIHTFLSGIYTLIFATEHTRFVQQIVKY